MTLEEKSKRRREKAQQRIDNKPVLGMAHYDMAGFATVKMQVIGLTKHSVTMRVISGGGTITLSTTNGMPIENFIKIEKMPCSIVPTLTKDGKTVEIPQGTGCGL